MTCQQTLYIHSSDGMYEIPSVHNSIQPMGNLIPSVDSLSCDSITISRVEELGLAKIASYPPGAKIFLNDVEQPLKTPARISDIPSNTYIYKLTLSGYMDAEGIITIEAGKTSEIFVILERIPGVVIHPIWYFLFGTFAFGIFMTLYRKEKGSGIESTTPA